MRRMMALLAVLLLLCGCARGESRLSQEQIDAYRSQYPLCKPNLTGLDYEFPDYEESIRRNNEVFTTCVAIVTVREEGTAVRAEYPLQPGSAEAQLANKMGESAIAISMQTWEVEVKQLVCGTLPDRVMQQRLTIGSRTEFLSLLPELAVGQSYLMTLTCLDPSWAAQSGYPQELWDICEAGTIFYLTSSGHVLSSLQAYESYDGIPMEQFCAQVAQMAQADIES